MNPHHPFPNPLNPNPNPNSRVSSSLENLIKLTQSTLQTFTTTIIPSSSPPNYLKCPSNPHHFIPPCSLFHHFLNCPSPLPLTPSLEYPKTLKSQQQLFEDNKFVQSLQDPSQDIWFSLDDYVDRYSDFFYRDCPNVVSSVDCDVVHNRMFSIPGCLCVECVNFVSDCCREMDNLCGFRVRVLPSEIWGVGCEVDRWNDYPDGYSGSVLRAFLCVGFVKERDFTMWVIVNSPRYGIIVDVYMCDHMVVLFKLCLKAVVREAMKSYGTWFNQSNAKSLSFKCPVLVGVMKWLSLQLSILYGETNAKSFAIAMLKHWLPKAASFASMFPLNNETNQITAIEKDSSVCTDLANGKSSENEGNVREGDELFGKSIFMYQIAAAIAALHERSMLEDRIKALRNPRSLTPFQRNAEHAYLSKKSDEERHKRPNYRPLIEHDGLHWYRQHDQDKDKTKTREELLAEERDYKRRRMSYRGKKLKRSKKEVMRDIIEEYMETIKQAGGIGCLAEGDGGAFSTQKTSSAPDSRNFKPNPYSASDEQDGNGKLSRNESYVKDPKSVDDSSSRNEHQKKYHFSQRHYEDQEAAHNYRHERHYHSRSPTRDRKQDRARENRSHKRNSGVTEMYEDESYLSSDRSRRYDHKLPHSTSISSNISSSRKDKRKLEYTDRHMQQRSNDKSNFFRRGQLNDRYDPYEVSDINEDEFNDSKYTRPEP